MCIRDRQLAVGLEAGQDARGMVVVEELAAELKIELEMCIRDRNIALSVVEYRSHIVEQGHIFVRRLQAQTALYSVDILVNALARLGSCLLYTSLRRRCVPLGLLLEKRARKSILFPARS